MSGPLNHSPAEILLEALVDLAKGTDPSSSQGVSDWPVFVSIMPDNPDNVIMITDVAGTDDGRFMIDGERQQHYGITVTVRSQTQNVAFARANSIMVALDESINRTSVTIGSDTYRIQSVSTRPGPIDAGPEQSASQSTLGSKRRLFTVNAVVDLKQTA